MRQDLKFYSFQLKEDSKSSDRVSERVAQNFIGTGFLEYFTQRGALIKVFDSWSNDLNILSFKGVVIGKEL